MTPAISTPACGCVTPGTSATGRWQFSIVLGVNGGMAATADNLIAMVRRLPADCVWQVIAIGRANLKLTAIGLALGGNARAGLEDTLYLRRGEQSPGNLPLVSVPWLSRPPWIAQPPQLTRLPPSFACRPASSTRAATTIEHWKIAVPNTSELPVPAAASRPTLTTVMDGTVAVLSMGLAPYNLMDRALNRELIRGLEWAQRENARAVVLRSSLRHFSAGADLDAMIADADQADVLDWGFTETLRAFNEHPAPIIASIAGVCVGGGFELALACDLIVAAESAKIGSVEVTVGLHPLMGAVQRLTQRAGAARAKEMALLGRRYPAATLERWNVINWVVADEQLERATMVLAQELAHGPSIAHAATKRLVSVTVNEGIAAADEAMAEIQRPIIGSADFRAAVRSYREYGIGMATFEGR